MNTSLLERLAQNTSDNPSKVALTFLKNDGFGGSVEQQLTYGKISNDTDELAKYLVHNYGLKKGDTAVLVFPPSLDFVVAFLACLKAGIIAVPVFPPHPSRRDTLLMFSRIVASSGAKFALTNSTYNHLKKLSSLKENFMKLKRNAANSSWPEQLKWIVTDGKVKNKSGKPLPLVSLDDLAFLQYTSGSTSEPKGVMISHGNLTDNLIKITNELEAHADDTVVVSWLPQYHDMGLIGSYLGVLFCGGCGYYMSPLTFIQNPPLWIEAISKYQGTHLQAPNFAFLLTARKFNSTNYRTIHEKNDSRNVIDLSSVRHIINAAEPVTETSINTFNDKFGKYGMREEVMFPTYGLAEHTVFVCSGGKQRLSISKHALETYGIVKEIDDRVDSKKNDLTRLVGCGFPSKQNVDVQIVNTDSFEALGENEVGEIWIHSPSKALGYFQKEKESRESFYAVLPVAGAEDIGYLRTGDLGFLHNQELFICGRMKDLIIVGGRNYYPQDIEATAESTSNLIRPGCSAAFTVDPISGNDEEVALILELREVPKNKETCEEIVQTLRKTVNQEHSLALSYITLLHPRTVPKTSSGKIARAWCRKAFQSNTLKSIHHISFKQKSSSIENNDNARMTTQQQQQQQQQQPMEIESSSSNPAASNHAMRNMSKQQIQKKLILDISRIMSMPAESIDVNAPLSSIMDSLNLSQFKGMVDNGYATKLSDEYLFRDSTNVNKLVEVVKLGYAPDDGGDPQPMTTMQTSNNGGLAQALGCPPGVVCCTVM